MLRVFWVRQRLFGSIGVGILVAAVLLTLRTWKPISSVLIGWDVAVLLYLALSFHLMAGSDVHDMRRRAAEQDEGRFAMLVLTIAAAIASLGAIFVELAVPTNGGARQPFQLALAAGTIVLSWAFIHTIFALHYAHEFYDEVDPGGMDFPGGDKEPDYWDFVYFSFVIGMTSQVSDVGITSKLIRRTATAHGILSFLFNAALLALTVNIAASAI